MHSKIFVLILLVISLAACSEIYIVPTSENTPVAKAQTENPCDNISMEQPEKLAFKGMDLYSWQEPGDDDCVFSILYGTNRNKMVWEVIAFATDLAELEKCFCNMPENENVIWMKYAQEEVNGERQIFPLPPVAIVDEVDSLRFVVDDTEVLRLMLAIAARLDWDVDQGDAVSAF